MAKELTRGEVPIAFLSSTCYDLKLVREDLKKFLEQELGFDVYASEYASFSVEHDKNTIDNCIQNVKQSADILVLIIGGRYGYETDSGKSITNLEYITAKEKHIPIYAFIDKKVMDMIGVWKDNPDGNFSSVVDNVKVFEFIDSLRNKEGIWVYGFENVDDIIYTLRIQIAQLFKRMMSLKIKLNQSMQEYSFFNDLKGDVLKLFLEKPIAWEYKVFGQILKDGINGLKNLERDYRYGISLENNYKKLSDYQEVLNWLQQKTNEFITLADIISNLINVRIGEALRAPGEPADMEYLIYVANKMVEVYRKVLNIGIEIKFVDTDEVLKKLVNCNLKICDSILSDIINFCELYQERINSITEETKGTLEITFVLSELDLDEYYGELRKMGKKFLPQYN